jgi:glycosyltransferase involved in cell wall biosynthesis
MGAVFALTRILLMPSLWHESGPRTPVEACSLGIPTVATDRGGLPEVLGDAGTFVTPPPPLVANHWLIPPLTVAIPWVEALRQLEDDANWYGERRQLAFARFLAHDPRERIGDIVRILQQLVAAKSLAGQR